jgi:hypothetical protein
MRNANILTWLFLSWVIIQPFKAQRESREQQIMMHIQRSLFFIVNCNTNNLLMQSLIPFVAQPQHFRAPPTLPTLHILAQ